MKRFSLTDEEGEDALVLVEDFILSGSLGRNHLNHIVKEGHKVSAVGLCHLVDGKSVLRLRDCDEVVLLWSPPEPTTEPETEAPTTEPPTTEAPATEPPATEVPTTEAPTTQPTEPPTTKPAAPAYPDNPPTGDGMVPGRILLTMGICFLLLGLTIKEKDRP